MSKPVIDDHESIFERLKKIKEEEAKAQEPIGTCRECQAAKVPCTGACYVFCIEVNYVEHEGLADIEDELDYACEGAIVEDL